MKSEAQPNTGVVTKVPRVQKKDSGAYICMVRPWGNSRNNLYPFNVDVTVDGEQSGKEHTYIWFRDSSSSINYSSIL